MNKKNSKRFFISGDIVSHVTDGTEYMVSYDGCDNPRVYFETDFSGDELYVDVTPLTLGDSQTSVLFSMLVMKKPYGEYVKESSFGDVVELAYFDVISRQVESYIQDLERFK